MTTTSKLTTTQLTFSDGATVNARLTATADVFTLAGAGGSAVVTLTNLKTPVAASDAVTKAYVDGLVTAGVTWKNAGNAATVSGDMTASTYSAAGLGTITWVGVPTIDGVTMVVGYRVVVQNSAASGDTGGDSRGIYSVTTVTTNMVLTRSADAAAASQANGAAIFVFDGTVNNDKAYVVTNNALTNWNGGVVFSVMSSVPAVVIGGTDTQVQYNNSGVLGADASYTYNKTSTTPVLGLGGAATGLTTFNLGTSTFASTIAGAGTGLMTVSGAGATTVTGATAASLVGGTSVAVTATTGAATMTSSTGTASLLSTVGAAVMTGATTSTVTAGSGLAKLMSTSGAAEVNGATSASLIGGTSAVITATTGAASMTASAGAASVTATSADLTLRAATSGNVIIDTATNDWTFNGTTLSSQGAFTTSAAVASNVSLFETTTSGTIKIGNATAGTGTITVDGDSSIINIGPTTTGAVNLGSSAAGALSIDNSVAMTVAASSTSVVIGSVANSTSTTITGADMNVGSATTTTTDINGITVSVGTTVTTGLNLLATGSSGNVALTAGTASTSGTVNISTVTATTATIAGGEVDITAGNGNTTGAGGALDFNAGSGGATGVGGAVTINAGAGGATSGAGGNTVIQAGAATAVGSAGNTVLKVAMTGTSTATNNLIEFQSGAGAQIGRMENNGDMYAVTFNTTSDVKYKTNIEHLNDPLAQIKKIEGYSYNWKKDFAGYNDKLQYGVLAQQMEEAGLHHLVAGTENSKAVNYIGLIPLLIEAVKELSAKLEKQSSSPAIVAAPRKVGRPKKVQ